MMSIALILGCTGCGLEEAQGKLRSITGAAKELLDASEEQVQSGQAVMAQTEERDINTNEEELYYGYSSLGEEEQKVYRQLAQGIQDFQENIPVAALTEEQLEKVMKVLLVDHPEYFWVDGTSSYTYQELPGGKIQNLEVQPQYQVRQEEAQALQAQIETKAQEWIASIPAQADTYEKIKAVYEILIQQVEYQSDSPQNQNIRSVFLEGRTVCMGYAKAAQYLLNKMGIFCTLVTGTVTGEETSSHAWNLVKIGEQYYYMDVTWGNPGYLNPQEQDAYISYSYLCCSSQELESTHQPDETIPLPACEDDSYNYYKNRGRWYQTYDRGQIYQVLLEDLNTDAAVTELKFADAQAYEEALGDLVEGSLVEEAVQDSNAVAPGESFGWQTYYGGSDNLLIVSWQ